MAFLDNVLSDVPVPAPFVGAGAVLPSRTRDYEDGPIAERDTTKGLQYQQWRAYIEGSSIWVEADNTPRRLLVPYQSETFTDVSIAFSVFGVLNHSWTDDGITYLRYFDTRNYALHTLTIGQVITPRLTLDDKRPTSTGRADIILSYLKDDGRLYFRAQRDHFRVEYLLHNGPFEALKQLYMNAGHRLQWLVVRASKIPQLDWPECLPKPQLAGKSGQVTDPQERTKLSDGRIQSRVGFQAVPVDRQFDLVVTREQAERLEEFYQFDTTGGAQWFAMEYRLPQGLGPWPFRFAAALPVPTEISPALLRYSGIQLQQWLRATDKTNEAELTSKLYIADPETSELYLAEAETSELYLAETETSELYLAEYETSKLYIIELEDSSRGETAQMESGHAAKYWRQYISDSTAPTAAVTGGQLRTTIAHLENSDKSGVSGFKLASGVFRELVVHHALNDRSVVGSFEVSGGSFDSIVIRYALSEKSGVDGFSLAGGSLSAPYDVTVPPSGLSGAAQDGYNQLTWSNNSRFLADQLLYKSTAEFDADSLPVPVSIGTTLREYQDSAVTSGVTYWYAIASKGLGGALYLSQIINVEYQSLDTVTLKFEGDYTPDDSDNIVLQFTEQEP